MDLVRITDSSFDPAAYINQLNSSDLIMGALVSFIGTMRDINEGLLVTRMYLEHYPDMAEKALHSIIEKARLKWPLGDVTVIHRVGFIYPNDPIVLVAVTSEHRGEGFKACEFIIDYLKTEAPFWKKEETSQGDRWVDERQTDLASKKRWGNE